ncbi:BRO family protein [Morganella morganii]|uniref:BRO family protein n=1 Tax=Morganella morganii TaxID=582 RepID=UPI003EB9B50C
MTNHSIIPFSFESYSIRAINFNGEPWFIAQDVCAVLGIKNATQATERLDEDERSMFNIGLNQRSMFDNRVKEIGIISESGMYTLVLRCRDAVKKGSTPHRFRKWVTAEVLPSIRKTGVYGKSDVSDLSLSTSEHTEKLALLRSAVNMLADNHGISYQRAYSLIHKQFGVRRIEDIDPDRLSDAVAYSYKEAIEGEFVGKEQPVATFRRKLAEKELNDLIWVWVAAKHMLDALAVIEPILRGCGDPKAATVTSMLLEYPRTLRNAVGFLRRESDHIVIDENNVNHLTWVRSLPLIRQLH